MNKTVNSARLPVIVPNFVVLERKLYIFIKNKQSQFQVTD